MFYEPDKNNHGLKYNPFKQLVVPRPIGWISTLNENGVPNLAPYSFFNAVAENPPAVAFCTGMRPKSPELKDSQRNAEKTGEFVVNLATNALREQMNRSSAGLPHGVNEFEAAGLETLPSRLVKPPRVKGTPVHLECRYLKTVEVPCSDPTRGNFVVFGQVVGVHIDDTLLVDGRVDIARAKPIARLGYMDYTWIEQVFTLNRPD